jgi:hypothetical protein
MSWLICSFTHTLSDTQKHCASLEEEQQQLQLYSFLFFSLSGTFSFVLPLEKVFSLSYLLVMVWLPRIILYVKV